MNHTPEPWIEPKPGHPNELHLKIRERDWFRARKCVNAMQGIEDPIHLERIDSGEYERDECPNCVLTEAYRKARGATND